MKFAIGESVYVGPFKILADDHEGYWIVVRDNIDDNRVGTLVEFEDQLHRTPDVYPDVTGKQRIDVTTVCDRCGVRSILRDCPNTIAARSYLLKDGWTKRGAKSKERWRCPDCSPKLEGSSK